MLPSNNKLQNHSRPHVVLIVTLVGIIGVVALVSGPGKFASARVVSSSGTTASAGPVFMDMGEGTADVGYDCTQIDVPAATATAVQAINPRGDITGQFTANGVTHGFLLPKNGQLVVIDHPNSTFTSALAINSEGVFVGNWEDAAHQRRGFIWNAGQFTDVQFPGSSFTSVPGLNDRGEVAGRYILAGQPHGFIFSDGVFSTVDVTGASDTAIFDLRSDEEIGGHYVASGVTHGFVLSAGALTTVDWPDATAAGSFNSVRGVTPGGKIVVGSYHGPTTQATHGFILMNRALTNFDYPSPAPGQVVSSTAIFGVNPQGTLVGGFNVGGSVSSTSQHGYVCRPQSNLTITNPIDDAQFFVRQHYLDFLNREPDPGGLAFWANEATSCGNDPQCLEVKRINVSAAFFLSIEFQQTGYLVERIYKASYGDANGISTFNGTHQLTVPIIRFAEFLPDTREVSRGVLVGQSGWETVLENNKRAFTNAFVQRSRFTSALPATLTPGQFVDQLFSNARVTPSAIDRQAAINEFGSATNTSDVAARARALRRVAENSTLSTNEFNRAFVLMQFFDYLRRNPNTGPDTDYSGYDFWLTKLNAFNGNFINAEMVKAFLTSTEYRQGFGQP